MDKSDACCPGLPPPQRARFDALKRQMFAEMGCAVARFRLAWWIPFNLMVVVVLAVTGMAPVRLGIEIVALLGSAVMFKLRLLKIQRMDPTFTAGHLFMGAMFYFLGVANTGGISSPLLVTCMPMLMSASLHPMEARVRGGYLRRSSRPWRGVARARSGARRSACSPSRSSRWPPTPPRNTCSSRRRGSFLFVFSAVYFMGNGVSVVYERRRLRARRATRGALQRERGPHARARGDGGASRARGEEPARGDQGALDPHGAERVGPEDGRAPRDRRRRGRPPPGHRGGLPLLLARARRPEPRARPARTRSRASSPCCSRRAREDAGVKIERDRRRGARARRRRAQAPPGAAERRAQRHPGVAARRRRCASPWRATAARARASPCTTTAPG